MWAKDFSPKTALFRQRANSSVPLTTRTTATRRVSVASRMKSPGRKCEAKTVFVFNAQTGAWAYIYIYLKERLLMDRVMITDIPV